MDYAYDSIHNSECFFYIDLFMAFDTVNHNIMLRKLRHIGVREREFLIGSRVAFSPTLNNIV